MKTINDYAELVKEKHALNKTIAPVETDLTDASRGYHIGEQFIINGDLFKAKTEIAQHDALVLNTNYEPADNLTEQIKNAGGGTGTDPRLDVFENNIAPVETDETDASRAYQVGEQLILDNILYDVIAPISEHDVITTTGSGANIEPADPLSSQFQTLTNQVKDMNNVYGSKNLLILTSYSKGETVSLNGGTIKCNDDGSYTINGTFTSDATLKIDWLVRADRREISNLAGKILTASCNGYNTSDIQFYTGCFKTDGTAAQVGSGAYEGIPRQYTMPSDAYTFRNWISIAAGTYSNVTIYPMVCLASVYELSPDWQSPSETNQQLTKDTTALIDNLEVNGAVNMLNHGFTTQTKNGITFTVNDDGTVTANGTSTASGNTDLDFDITLPKGTYKMSGCPSGGSNTTYRQLLNIGKLNTKYAFDYGDGAVFTLTEETTSKFYVTVASGATVSNLTFKPMITLASYNGDYVPYAKSNKELTEELTIEYGNITTTVTMAEWNLHNVKKYGHVVEAQLTCRLEEAVSAWGTLATIPIGFRPPSGNYPQVVGMKGDYTSFVNLQIAPDGSIQPAISLNSGETIRMNITYIV